MFDLDQERVSPPPWGRAGREEPLHLPPSLFRAFRELAAQQAGIQIRDGKEALVASRIAGRLRELGLADPVEYLARLRDDPTGGEMVRFLDALCTTFTGFFRDAEHFSILAGEAVRRLGRGERRLRVWCAAAASGEEPYSAAMALSEAYAGATVDFRVLATDLSTSALSTAIAGRYTERQLAPVPERLRWKYFTPAARGPAVPNARGRGPAASAEPEYDVTPRLRERVVFARMNLALTPFPMTAPFDVILCRNVMIYFDPAVRQRLLDELGRLLRPGGLLMVGHAETLTGLRHRLVEVQPSVLRRPQSG